MNYRHAFHAGNFADVLKHVVLARVIAYLQRKPQPIRVIETHAGAGLYALGSEAAERTGEWRDGVSRMELPFDPAVETLLEPWRLALAGSRAHHGDATYPGSPGLCRELMRPDDAYLGAELHPATFAELAAFMGRDRRMKALHLDAWVALRANVPPRERRGLVLIDPAFEAADEWPAMARELIAAWRKWPTGCFIAWYPLKNPRLADDFAAAVGSSGAGDVLRLELMVDDIVLADRLAGAGLLIINPPWTLRLEGEMLLPALAARLARGPRAGYRCESLAG
jgi:23S rRNA (adenine2030-N6)-methyltransferase